MCHRCTSVETPTTHTTSRRGFLALAGAAAAGAALPDIVLAQAAPPKPQNVVSPDAALDLLVKGNDRYVTGKSTLPDFKHNREALTRGQNPYAAILSCADSRIAPEYAFDTGRGDLFVCRVAGNFLNDDALASFEYATLVLNTPLFMVLGHKACGAVDAAIKSTKDGATLPGHLPSLVTALAPAVKAVANEPGVMLDNAIRQNVRLNVEKLKNATPIMAKAVAEKKVRVVGAVYNLDNGRVELVS